MIRLVLFLLFLASPVQADFVARPDLPNLPAGFAPRSLSAPDTELGLAQITIRAVSGQFEMRARIAGNVDVLAPVLPNTCERQGAATLEQDGFDALLLAMRFHCDAARGAILLPWPVETARLRVLGETGDTDTMIDAGQQGLAIPISTLWPERPAWRDIGATYLFSGVEHVLIGLDHLAFVLCLIFMATRRQLLLMVTAFTLGHSITLILASMGHIRLPIGPVEACIALSIVFLAREVLLGKTAGSREWGITLGFGLLHGLGFASALEAFGLPDEGKILALVAFNVGVELGQLLFVGLVLMTSFAYQSISSRRTAGLDSLRNPVLLVVGGVALAWTVERTLLLAS